MNTEQDATAVATVNWTQFDSPSTAVITAVADEAGVDPVSLGPLYEVIDPDALDTLVVSAGYSRSSPTTSVKFQYQGYRVVVKANGRVYLYEQTDRISSPAEPQQARTIENAD